MLTLTKNAITVVKTIVGQKTESAEGGLRISGSEAENSLSVSIASEPKPYDQIVENEGARVYLEATAAAELSDKKLDAEIDTEGAVTFAVAPA